MIASTTLYTDVVTSSRPGTGTIETIEIYERRWLDGRKEVRERVVSNGVYGQRMVTQDYLWYTIISEETHYAYSGRQARKKSCTVCKGLGYLSVPSGRGQVRQPCRRCGADKAVTNRRSRRARGEKRRVMDHSTKERK